MRKHSSVAEHTNQAFIYGSLKRNLGEFMSADPVLNSESKSAVPAAGKLCI